MFGRPLLRAVKNMHDRNMLRLNCIDDNIWGAEHHELTSADFATSAAHEWIEAKLFDGLLDPGDHSVSCNRIARVKIVRNLIDVIFGRIKPLNLHVWQLRLCADPNVP